MTDFTIHDTTANDDSTLTVWRDYDHAEQPLMVSVMDEDGNGASVYLDWSQARALALALRDL